MSEPLKRYEDFTEAEDLEYYRSVRACPSIEVTDADAMETSGYSIHVYEGGRASKVKGKITFTPWQWRRLVRQLVEDGIEIKDWSQVDLSGWVED
ncbi:MAG: hypothetical protein WC749_01935 [Dehalococcoidia bacterium]